ncbi:MAG: metallopeptidase family protein [Elusimicrobia bacterium]|nr:metallopeptidase family protein [Elusimicrobiota bacterium]
MEIPRPDFLQLAEEAFAELPQSIRELLYNVEIDVKALPGREAGRFCGSRGVLGLYHGLTREQMLSPLSGSYLPPRIILYQRNIEALCFDQADILRQIRLTLRHEIAHHLGISDRQLRAKWPEGA